MESLLVVLIAVVEVTAPVLLLAAGVVLYFMVRRMRHERTSLCTAEGNAVAMEMEKMRHQASLLLSLAALSVLLGFGMSSFIAGEAGGTMQAAIMAAGVVVALVFLVKGLSLRKRINTLFKEHFVAVELGKVFSNLHYAPHESLPRDEVAGLDFFSCLDVMSGDDLVIAKYKGIAFAQCDLCVQEQYTETKSDGDGSSSTETCTRDIFRGRVMRIDVATTFPGLVQVVDKRFPKINLTSQKGWNKVETNLSELDGAFTVYAKNTHDAFAVLTEKMIAGIFDMSKSINGSIAICYKEQHMYVFLLNDRSAFSVSSGKTLDEEQLLLQQDIQLMTIFLDAMEGACSK